MRSCNLLVVGRSMAACCSGLGGLYQSYGGLLGPESDRKGAGLPYGDVLCSKQLLLVALGEAR